MTWRDRIRSSIMTDELYPARLFGSIGENDLGTDVKQVSKGSEVDERMAALITNSNAVRSIASAVEGTLGPKGLNCMLVDRFGDVTITNDGSTILDKIDVNHPAARMLIGIAKAQEEEVGDEKPPLPRSWLPG